MVNGRGNLIVGYNEPFAPPADDEGPCAAFLGPSSHTGSHNIVLGSELSYTSFGGIVTGAVNKVDAPGAMVFGGSCNLADGDRAVVVAGQAGRASGIGSVMIGGHFNGIHDLPFSGSGAGGGGTVVIGGRFNGASGSETVTIGGEFNVQSETAGVAIGGCEPDGQSEIVTAECAD
jgi:hypothetical protein